MSSARQKADFITGVVKNAIEDGWSKAQFMHLAEVAWETLTLPGPGQFKPLAADETSEHCTHPDEIYSQDGNSAKCAHCGVDL